MTVPLNKIRAFKISAKVRAVPYLLQATDDHVPTLLAYRNCETQSTSPQAKCGLRYRLLVTDEVPKRSNLYSTTR